ncbi:MAG: hypothetical protein WCZ23_10705 [Rhodospirillaceae bacterium]
MPKPPDLRRWWLVPHFAKRGTHLRRLPPDLFLQFQIISSSPLSGAHKTSLTGRQPETLAGLPPIDFQPYAEVLTWADALELYRLLGPNNLTLPFTGDLLKGRLATFDPQPTPAEARALQSWATRALHKKPVF